MYLYKISGTIFQSNVTLPELNPLDLGKPEFSFELCKESRRFVKPHWLNHWYLYDGSVWLSFAKMESGYLLRFPEYADFVVSADGSSIEGYLRKRCPQETMRHLLLNQVIPIVLSQLGKLVLHASACATPQGVMAFMGTTGMGKSTLAASFGLKGFTVITDDCLLVEQQQGSVVGIPSYGGLRLWPESVSALFEEEPALQSMAHYTEKKRVLLQQAAADGPLSLRAMYILIQPEHPEKADCVSITPLGPSEALFEIVKHTFQLDVTDREKLAQSFRRYEWLVKSVPFFKLAYPRDHAMLPTVHSTVLNHLYSLADQQTTSTSV